MNDLPGYLRAQMEWEARLPHDDHIEPHDQDAEERKACELADRERDERLTG